MEVKICRAVKYAAFDNSGTAVCHRSFKYSLTQILVSHLLIAFPNGKVTQVHSIDFLFTQINSSRHPLKKQQKKNADLRWQLHILYCCGMFLNVPPANHEHTQTLFSPNLGTIATPQFITHVASIWVFHILWKRDCTWTHARHRVDDAVKLVY